MNLKRGLVALAAVVSLAAFIAYLVVGNFSSASWAGISALWAGSALWALGKRA